jgi:putative hydrolase of the HAD superfamily
MIKLVIFDLGNTLIHQVEDIDRPLDQHPIRPIEGALDALRRVASRYQVAVLSNTHRTTNKQLRRVLKRLGLDDVAIRVFSSVSVGARKPMPRAFQAVLSAFAVAPSEALMVGDSFEEDVAGAVALGMHAIWVSEGGRPDQGADLALRRLSELTPELIETIHQAALPHSHVLPESLSVSPETSTAPSARHNSSSDDSALSRIVEQEAQQEWRRIGLGWLRYGLSLRPELSPEAEMWLRLAKPDGAAHHFPSASVADSSWRSLSDLERAGRAFRYAGYHFEEDGDQQTTFLHYYRSGECFWDAEKSAEAARSYFLALMSFVRRYGQLDETLLDKLGRAYELAVVRDEAQYLPPIVVQYRRIGAALRSAGNFAQYLRLRRLRLGKERELARVEGRWLKFTALSAWGITSSYGQSILGWCLLFAAVNLLVFPLLYTLPGVAASAVPWRHATVFALGRMIAYSPFDLGLTTLGQLLTVSQAMFTLMWISVLAAIIVTRSQE